MKICIICPLPWKMQTANFCNTLHTVQPFFSGCFFTSTCRALQCALRGHEEHIAVVRVPCAVIDFPTGLSLTRALSRLCKMQALGHYKICTICRNIFQLFARNNAVDFFTRYISAGAAPGCLGIMSVCIEQKIKTRVCAPRAAAACSPIAAFACGSLLFNLVAIQTASSMVFFFLLLHPY